MKYRPETIGLLFFTDSLKGFAVHLVIHDPAVILVSFYPETGLRISELERCLTAPFLWPSPAGGLVAMITFF